MSQVQSQKFWRNKHPGWLDKANRYLECGFFWVWTARNSTKNITKRSNPIDPSVIIRLNEALVSYIILYFVTDTWNLEFKTEICFIIWFMIDLFYIKTRNCYLKLKLTFGTFICCFFFFFGLKTTKVQIIKLRSLPFRETTEQQLNTT